MKDPSIVQQKLARVVDFLPGKSSQEAASAIDQYKTFFTHLATKQLVII
jgi:hypothetical protein